MGEQLGDALSNRVSRLWPPHPEAVCRIRKVRGGISRNDGPVVGGMPCELGAKFRGNRTALRGKADTLGQQGDDKCMGRCRSGSRLRNLRMDQTQNLENFGIGDDELDQLPAIKRDLEHSHLVLLPAAREPPDAEPARIPRNCLRDCPWIGSPTQVGRGAGGSEQR